MANDASVPVATDPALPVNHSKDLPTLTTKFQALREEFEAVKAALDPEPCSYAQVTAGSHSR